MGRSTAKLLTINEVYERLVVAVRSDPKGHCLPAAIIDAQVGLATLGIWPGFGSAFRVPGPWERFSDRLGPAEWPFLAKAWLAAETGWSDRIRWLMGRLGAHDPKRATPPEPVERQPTPLGRPSSTS